MSSEPKEVFNLDDVGGVLRVVLPDCQQNLDFDLGLVGVAPLVLDNLERHHFLLLVVVHLKHLSVRALPEELDQLVAVRQVVVQQIVVFGTDD